MPKTRIILVRHGETEWNVEQRFRGHHDIPLNETGIAQARALARRLAPEPVAAVYCSRLQRASHTAEIIAAPHDLTPIGEDSLANINYGDLEGLTLTEVSERFPFNLEHTLCIFRENCGGVPVLEHNGDFYSCDHYVDTEHLVGNIMHGTVAEFLDSENQRVFGNVKSDTLPMYCRNCEVKPMCNGECPKNRFIKLPDGEEGLNYLCEGYKYFLITHFHL